MNELVSLPPLEAALVRTEVNSHAGQVSLYGPGCPKLSEALAQARDRCKSAAKSSKNEHYRYSYASADTVIDVASQAMEGSGLAIVPVFEELAVLGDSSSAIYVLNRRMLLSHSSGEYTPLEIRGWPVIPDRGRPLDKAYAIALTSSLAYKLRDLLQMPRGTQDDVAAQDDRQTPPASVPSASGGADPNVQPPAAAAPPARITEAQEQELIVLIQQHKRTVDDVTTWLKSANLSTLKQLPAHRFDWARGMIQWGQVTTDQSDQIAKHAEERKLNQEAFDNRLQQKYGVSRIRLLNQKQAEEVIGALLTPARPAA